MGLGKNFIMTVGKAVVGYSSNSSALIADAAHSASDMVSFKCANYAAFLDPFPCPVSSVPHCIAHVRSAYFTPPFLIP
jgi:hypothetical protein